jgi:hypothetical protein
LRDVALAVMQTDSEHPASEILERTLNGAQQKDDIAVLAICFT